MIVAPLCWKANEWIGLSLVCSIQSALDSLGELVNVDRNGELMVVEDTLKRGKVLRHIKKHAKYDALFLKKQTFYELFDL